MWYFAWILGTLLACAFGVITAVALEHVEQVAAPALPHVMVGVFSCHRGLRHRRERHGRCRGPPARGPIQMRERRDAVLR